MKVYIDGTYYEKEDAKVSVFDHGLLYGDGVFEGIRVYAGKAFLLEAHVERLFASAKAILLEIPMTYSQMTAAVNETIRKNETRSGYIRLVVTRGVGNLGIDPTKCPKASVIIIVGDIELYPQEFYARGIAIVSASSRRLPPDGIDARIKSLNYLNNVLAKFEALQAGCLEAVLLSRDGYVTECTGDNIFIIKAGKLLTPDTSVGALCGITRGYVMGIAAELGIACEERQLTRYDLYTSDECFLTGTGAEIMPVVSIDGRKIGDGTPGSRTRSLIEAFNAKASA
jgi:branched-chain amino acid aminotransferase